MISCIRWEIFTRWVEIGGAADAWQHRGHVTTCADDRKIAMRKARARFSGFSLTAYMEWKVKKA